MDSLIQSFTARLGNVPSHKSVGKNGTFWLPPDSSNSFSSKLNNLSGKKSQTSNSTSGNSSQVAKNRDKSGRSGSIQSPLLNSRDVKTNSPVRPSQAPVNIKQNSSPLLQPKQNTGHIKASPNPPATNLNSFALDKISVNRAEDKKPSKSTDFTIKDNKENQFHVGEKEEDGSRNNKHRHGTKDAVTSESMIFSQNIDDMVFKITSSALAEKRFHHRAVRILEHIAKEIASKISYLSKNGRKIVRMAFDLPNGAPLSVRIEQNQTNLTISFISQDKATVEILEFIREFFGREKNLNNSTDISVHIFRSYQEMDIFFQQAA